MILNNTQVLDQTTAIERIPFKPGLIGSLNLYAPEVVRTDAITFDVRDNSLAILDDHLRNTAQKNSTEDAPYQIHTLAIPHYPIEKTIGREKLAGVRAFGKESEAIIAGAVASELEKQAETHDLHEEYLKALMTLNGVVATAHYGTIDMAAEFGVVRPTQALTPATLLADLRSAMAKSKAGLKTGGRTAGYVALVGADLFESILTSADVLAAYQFSQANGNPLRNELGTVSNGYSIFRFGVVDFVLYDDTFTTKTGTVIKPLADNAGVLVPRTTIGRTFYGPASTLSGLGGVGSRRFAQTYRDPRDRFVAVESEQSTLVINQEFGATVALTIGT
jgi:hypothetical protein